MPELTVISWRAIPAQVTAGKGRGAARVQLSDRFQEAIDAAAMRAGLIGTDTYLEQWRREGRPCRRRPRGRGRRRPPRSSSIDYPDERLERLAARTEKRSPRDRDRSFLGHERGRDRVRPPVRRHRRADQPNRPEAPGRGDEGRQLRHRDRRRDRAGGGRRADARRQRRDPARRRAGDPASDDRARAVDHRRAALDRLVDRRGARGGSLGLSGQASRQLGHGRGRADGAGAAARREVRRRGRRDLE